MTEFTVTKDNLPEALAMLRVVMDEPPLTKKQRLEALLLQIEELQRKIAEYEQNDHMG